MIHRTGKKESNIGAASQFGSPPLSLVSRHFTVMYSMRVNAKTGRARLPMCYWTCVNKCRCPEAESKSNDLVPEYHRVFQMCCDMFGVDMSTIDSSSDVSWAHACLRTGQH